ncbi:Ig kappa chain V-V region T1 [Sciurus carolinensis]|uniref:Ig kappa chain V-V region T1 n=1 Tax=Sciurus carolinensis TaxID=30640 RepID=A0AA41NJC0_SCICA|nr:Ig kappa chain V-V region T1 [Sciurus carolinensis]
MDMRTPAQLLGLLLLGLPGACGDVEMTQSPGSLAVCAGDMVTISCRSSQGLSSNQKDNIAWHQQSQNRLPDCSSPGHPRG